MPNIIENTLFYEEFGNGPAMLLLHGFLENRKMWMPFVPELSKKHRLILIDLPGHGKSDVLKGAQTLALMAGELKKLVDHLQLKDLKFVGHSMGGYVALTYAQRFPEDISGICLLNSTPKADTAERVALREHGITVAQKNYHALVSMSVANLFSQHLRSRLTEAIQITKQEALQTPLEGYINSQKAMAIRDDSTEFWKNGSFKKMMILGAQDTLIRAEDLKNEFMEYDVQIDVLEGGHMLTIENFKGVLAILKQF